MSRTTMIRVLVLVCTGILLPAASSAQATSGKAAVLLTTAEQLEAFARSPKFKASDWIEAGRALERAARLRTSGDPVAVNDVLGAATAYEIAAMLVPARKNAVEGAKRAIDIGEIYTAAHAYLAAARFSFQLQEEKAALSYLYHAKRLVKSSNLTPDQKYAIMAQVGRT